MTAQTPIRPEITLSWQRSALCGVDPDAAADTDPVPDLDSADRLLSAARPVLDEVAVQLSGTGFCILLADRDCRVVARVFASAGVERFMERIGAVLGSQFGEDHAGTNALGTPLELGHAIVVNGEEHFQERFKGLSCYGHPIVHPVTHRVEGILDMTGIASQANPLFAPFLARAARDIESRLLEGSRVSQQRLVDAFQRVVPQRNLAVTAIGEDLLLSNRIALDLLGVADHAALRGIAADLRADQSRTVVLELASGEAAEVRADRVAGTDGGTVFLVQPQRRAEPIRRKPAAGQSAGRRIAAQLARLRASNDPVAISGEPGSGRTSAMRDLAGTALLHSIDACGISQQGTQEWVGRLNALTVDAGVLAIENVHLVPESLHPVLTALIAARSGPRIILTSNPIRDLPGVTAALVARCPCHVELPALRQRRRELAELAQAVLDDVAPGLELTPSAVEALAASEWPGNIAELVVVLHSAAAQRSSNRIDVDDLPEGYRATLRVRRLGGRERAERQAIVDALCDCGGNKVHAANRLGISRSTLYTRMRALDITA